MLIPGFGNYTTIMHTVNGKSGWKLYENFVNCFWTVSTLFPKESENKKGPTGCPPSVCVCACT